MDNWVYIVLAIGAMLAIGAAVTVLVMWYKGKLIDETIIGRNAERNRRICRRVFLDGVPYERVAEEFDISRSQVERVIRTGFTRIKNHI